MENTRQAANLTLDAALISEAKALKVNLSRAAEEGIREALRRERIATWQVENATALQSSNSFVDRDGLPLGDYRQF